MIYLFNEIGLHLNPLPTLFPAPVQSLKTGTCNNEDREKDQRILWKNKFKQILIRRLRSLDVVGNIERDESIFLSN